MKFQTMVKTFGNVMSYSVQEFSSSNKQDKLAYIENRIIFLNKKGDIWEQKMNELGSINEKLEALLELLNEAQEQFNVFNASASTKESVRTELMLKANLTGIQQEIAERTAKKEELEIETTEIRKLYKKEFMPLKRMLDKKKNAVLLEQYKYRRTRLSSLFAANISFTKAANDFSKLMFEIKDLSVTPLIGNDYLKVYKEQNTLEASIDLNEDDTFLVSLSLDTEKVEVGKYDNKSGNLKKIGSGINFHSIQWTDDDYNNQLIVLLFGKLVGFKASFSKESKKDGLKHSYLVENVEVGDVAFQ